MTDAAVATAVGQDADGLAVGDELSVYAMDPLAADSHGNTAFNSEELFGIFTNPLP